ncbi:MULTISPECIES: hypothetical protein [Deefgea]|uniref:Uncharacterized protein n=1 Tax=Deefgea piscis TaxID=2739061 RepID=A0A6M8SU32_9NEIS|nr:MULTISPECIES: hypothetical protein [Deefgea]MBM5575700.1 hypothetical protein [Deefgea sp. CFH1-16]QKJ67588.1 hypothetical protein HQN60_13190 [Deefgea piscis]
MANQQRELKKQQLVFRSQLCRLQLETRLLESRRPMALANALLGNTQSLSMLSKLAQILAKAHPSMSRLTHGVKIFGVLMAVLKLLRNK